LNSTISQALKIARFDLGTSIRTSKAVVTMAVYAGLALLVAAVTTFLQNKLLAEPGVQEGLKTQMDQIQQVISAALGNDTLLANHLVNMPVALMVFFWLTQSFLPLLIAVISSDMLNREIRTKSARFVLLRASRSSLVIGKWLSHITILIAAIVLSWIVFLGYLAFNLNGFNLVQSIPLILKFFGFTLLIGFCYLGLTSLMSSLVDGSGTALLLTIVVLLFLAGLAQSDMFGWASPSHYRYKIWSPRADEILAGVGAYVLFGSLFLSAAWQRFLRRDI